MTSVFVSYSRKDMAIVQQVMTFLGRQNMSMWIDHENLAIGTPNWDASIRQGIAQADFVLYMASPDAIQSNYVLSELHIAHDQKKIIIPMWIAGDTDTWSSIMPVGFVLMQGIDARGTTLTAGLQQLSNRLSIKMTPLPLPPTSTEPHFTVSQRVSLPSISIGSTLAKQVTSATINKSAISDNFIITRMAIIFTGVGLFLFISILCYWLYGSNIALMIDQLKSTLATLMVIAISSGAIALIATGLNLLGLRQPTLGRGLSTFFSGATLVTAVLFLVLTLFPHTNVANFVLSFQDKCQTPLNEITADIQSASTAAKKDQSDDTTFVADMAKYSGILQADGTAASSQYTPAVRALTPPQIKYQKTIDACAGEFIYTANFLTSPQGITLPSTLTTPFAGQQLSAAMLLQDSSALVQGTLPGGSQKYSAALISPLVAGVLDQAINTCDAACTHLKSDGAQLQTDAFTPFKAK